MNKQAFKDAAEVTFYGCYYFSMLLCIPVLAAAVMAVLPFQQAKKDRP